MRSSRGDTIPGSSPRDPDFAAKAGVVLDLYQRVFDGCPLGADQDVISADEKTQVQARCRCHPTLPPGQARVLRVEHEYERGGALAYLAAWDVHQARLFGRCAPTTGIEPFGRLVEQVMSSEPYASAQRVFWIVDNGSSHRGQASVDRLEGAWGTLRLVHLPTHASWLNQVELVFSVIQRKVLTPNDFLDLGEVERRRRTFQRRYEHTAVPFDWRYTRADLDRLLRPLDQHEHLGAAARPPPTNSRDQAEWGRPTRGGTMTTIPSLSSGDSQRSPSLGCFARGVARPDEAELAGGGLPARRDGPQALGDGQPRPRVLVVDDADSITELVATALRYEGFQVEVAGSGRDALRAATSFRPHLIVLDVMLPDLDGFEVQRRLAADRLRVPILFLTARDTTQAKVHGLTMGADDYVTKPFSLEELVARVQAVLRRSGQADKPGRLEFADLEMDEDTHEVWRGGVPIELSPTEFNLLRYLLLNARRVVSKAQIIDHVWRYDFGGDPRIVETYVSYLRKKVDFKQPPLLHTMRGVGYSLRLPR